MYTHKTLKQNINSLMCGGYALHHTRVHTLLHTPYPAREGMRVWAIHSMGYGTSKYMYTSSICMYCMHMFTREEHAVVPCEPMTASLLTVRHEIHMCCASAPCQHCSRTADTTQNAVGAVLAVQKTVKNFRLRRALLQPTNRA